jgi:hypothetical protein
MTKKGNPLASSGISRHKPARSSFRVLLSKLCASHRLSNYHLTLKRTWMMSWLGVWIAGSIGVSMLLFGGAQRLRGR